MARTASSLDRRSVTVAISDHMARLIALRIFGRLNTTVAMGPSCSTRMWSLMSSLPWGLAGGPQSGSRATSLAEGRPDFNRAACLFGDDLPGAIGCGHALPAADLVLMTLALVGLAVVVFTALVGVVH